MSEGRVRVEMKVLTLSRWTLLCWSQADGPSSIRALSRALGRGCRGVLADVMTLIEAELIAHGEDGKVSVPWSRITVKMALDAAA